MKTKNLHLSLALSLALFPVLPIGANAQAEYYTGYEGLVLGESKPRSATDAITEQATQVPGDIYRGTVFGAEQKNYHGDVLGNRPRATRKLVYDTSLIRAIKISDADRVRTLLFAHVNVNEKNYAGITPMTVAGEKGNMEVIRLLVEDGKADINEPSSYGVTPLIAAAAAGQAEAIQYLLKHGADATAKDNLGKTALIYASNFDASKAVADLVALDQTSINLPDNSGNTPLIYSAQKGLIDNVKVLLNAGANVNYRNPNTGLSALAAAAADGDVALIKLLVKNGKADINLPDAAGRTPIFYAVEKNKPEALRTLLMLGADPNTKDNNGTTALMRASSKNYQDCIKVLLKQKNIDLNAQDYQGRSAVSYGAYAENPTALKELLSAKADINAKDHQGNTPLMHTIKAKNDRNAVFLVQQGADLTPVNAAGESAFSLAKQYIPNSTAANVLGVKQSAVQQQALQIQAEKLANVRQLEQQLAQEEAAISQMKDEQESAARERLEQEYQAKTAALENDPELLRLQQQLEEARARKAAALEQEMNQRLDSQLGRATTATQKANTQATQAQQAAQQKASQVQQQANKQVARTQKTVQQKQTAVNKQVKNTRQTVQRVKGETIPQSSIAPREVSMADLLN